MNERIRQLAEQANTIGDWGEDITEGRYFVCDNLKNLEKFAELIVRECRDIVGKTRDDAVADGWTIEEALSTAMYDIDQHFGV